MKSATIKTVAMLQAAAVSYLRYERKCYLVCLERTPVIDRCIPDVCGVLPNRTLIEIEIKATLSDFRNNRHKRGLQYRLWPQQYYFLVPPEISERIKGMFNPEVLGEATLRAGLLTIGENGSFGFPEIHCLKPATVNKTAARLGVLEIGRMVRHQSGTLASALLRVARNGAPVPSPAAETGAVP